MRVRYIFVEGNVGAGKSTLIDRVQPVLRELLGRDESLEDVVAVPEPIERWTNVGGTGHNMLEAFYQDKKRYAAQFQSHALVTRVQAVNEAIAAWCLRTQPEYAGGEHTLYVLCERSIFTDRHVFVEALRQDGDISPLEHAAYTTWWEFWQQRLYPGDVAAVVYLQATPDRCLSQMHRRGRTEEAGVPKTYLQRLNELHEVAMARPDTWRGARRICMNVAELGNLPFSEAAAMACAKTIYNFVTDTIS